MTRAFERGEDLHALTARTMLGLDEAGWLSLPEDERKQHRKHAKPVNFGRLYGQGAARSRRLGAGAVRPDPRPGHSEGVDQGLSRRPIPTSRAGAGTSRAPASAAAASRSGARAGAFTRSTGIRTATATPSASICRSKAPAPTPSCWRWRRSTRPCSRRGSRAARSRRRTTRSCWKCREADAARAADPPAGGDDRRLRGDLPRRAAAGPRRGEDRPVLGGDEVARPLSRTDPRLSRMLSRMRSEASATD